MTGERVDVVLAGPFETDEPAFHARLAQVVYTATADSDITQVRVLGKTYTREAFGPEPFTEPKPPTRKTAAPANPRDVQTKLASLGGDSPDIGTPSGKWKIYRKEVKSWSVPYKTWLPYAAYWVGGWALHGYADVPAQPASHGCARLPLPEAKIVYDFVSIGTPVQVI